MRSSPRSGAWTVEVTRPDPSVTLFDVSLSGYHEFFAVVVGEKLVSITSYEPTEDAFSEPQLFVFAKPYGWRDDLDDEEALMQVWQAVGVQR